MDVLVRDSTSSICCTPLDIHSTTENFKAACIFFILCYLLPELLTAARSPREEWRIFPRSVPPMANYPQTPIYLDQTNGNHPPGGPLPPPNLWLSMGWAQCGVPTWAPNPLPQEIKFGCALLCLLHHILEMVLVLGLVFRSKVNLADAYMHIWIHLEDIPRITFIIPP